MKTDGLNGKKMSKLKKFKVFYFLGGFCLDEFNTTTQTRVFRAESMEAISEILNVVGVNKWEDLPGKYIRFEDVGWGSTVTKIGNIVNDKWFDMKNFFSCDS